LHFRPLLYCRFRRFRIEFPIFSAFSAP